MPFPLPTWTEHVWPASPQPRRRAGWDRNKTYRLPAHRLRDCSQPNITCPGNRARGSIFPHPYSGKISTSSSNGRPGVYCNVLARGRTGSEHFSASILDIPVCNLVTLQIRRRTAHCCPTTINLVLSWKFRDLQKKFHRAILN